MQIQGEDFVYLRTIEECRAVNRIVFEKGNAPAQFNMPRSQREFDEYYHSIILPGIKEGTIGDGVHTKFDDRKLRYDGSRIEGDALIIRVGPTWWKPIEEDLYREMDDCIALQRVGKERYDDPYAYFTRALGVAVMPITQDGAAFIGVRGNHVEIAGKLNFVAGFMKFYENMLDINAEEQVLSELEKEFGVSIDDVLGNLKLLGIAAQPYTSDMDIAFLAQIAKTSDYFTSGEWMKHVDDREHKELIAITNLDQISLLLSEGRVEGDPRTFQIMYSTRLELEALALYHQGKL
jgi:hypothetical protein